MNYAEGMSSEESAPACPACGGAGGGPFGRAGSAWDREDYVCPRCKGTGLLIVEVGPAKPGLSKAAPPIATPASARKKAAGSSDDH